MTLLDLVPSSKRDFVCENEISFSTKFNFTSFRLHFIRSLENNAF